MTPPKLYQGTPRADKHLQLYGRIEHQLKKISSPLYTNGKEAEKGIREKSGFTIATNNIKYLGLTLNKVVKYLFDNNSKSLKKEIEEDTKK